MTDRRLRLDSILRVGEVVEVDGRKVIVRVDKNKNVSDLLIDGDVLRNVSVNAFVEIRKGFQSLVGRVDGERLEEARQTPTMVQEIDRNQRFLEVSMAGYIGADGRFRGGLKELPLIGNEVFIVTKEKIETIHNLSNARPTVSFAETERDGFKVSFPLDGLLNSHIAIFGNTGSGKSNTLAAMLASFVQSLGDRNRSAFEKNVRILLLDFNGEFSGPQCITKSKRVFNLKASADATRIPFRLDAFLDIEVLSILLDATEKTQKPFLRRAIRFRKRALETRADGRVIGDPTNYIRGIMKRLVMRSLLVSDKTVAGVLLDHLCFVLCGENDELDAQVREELEWHGRGEGFKKRNGAYFNSTPSEIETLVLHNLAESYEIPTDALTQVVHFIYLQLVGDILDSRAVNEHVAPVISRLLSRKDDIEAVFAIGDDAEFWSQNVCVVNLERLGVEMKKAVPLLLAKHLYSAHKRERNKKALLFVIDEAHNILSRESVRESDSWRDYRLETFEEIIKEGRKFGVFLTISSQRPADISPTITSQAHNYFIHRLVNQRDLEAIANAVSFIDRLSEKSIPTLPTGTCIFSGIASQMPLTLAVRQLPGAAQPKSETLQFEGIVPKGP